MFSIDWGSHRSEYFFFLYTAFSPPSSSREFRNPQIDRWTGEKMRRGGGGRGGVGSAAACWPLDGGRDERCDPRADDIGCRTERTDAAIWW